MIGRRDFITLLGSAAVVWPLAAKAREPPKLRTIGFLGASTPEAVSQWTAAFVQQLRELGWVEGRTVAIEYRWAEGRVERFTELAAEFVRLRVDVIVTHANAAVIAAKARNVDHPDCIWSSGRSGWCWPSCEPGPARRQRHRPVASAD